MNVALRSRLCALIGDLEIEDLLERLTVLVVFVSGYFGVVTCVLDWGFKGSFFFKVGLFFFCRALRLIFVLELFVDFCVIPVDVGLGDFDFTTVLLRPTWSCSVLASMV